MGEAEGVAGGDAIGVAVGGSLSYWLLVAGGGFSSTVGVGRGFSSTVGAALVRSVRGSEAGVGVVIVVRGK
ncbi:MAG: hypothetical protein M3358_06860 [Actinomycetota bacterium]|nr:hypothetical protein [Actinomycetota bacterium]